MVDFFTNNYQWLFSGLGVVVILIGIKKIFPKKNSKGLSSKNILTKNSNNNVIVSGSNINIHVSDSTEGSSIRNKITPINPDQKSQIVLVVRENDSQIESYEEKDIINTSLKSIHEEIDRMPAILRTDAWKHHEGLVIRCHLKLLSLTLGQNNTAEVSFIETGMISPFVNVEINLDTYPFLKIAKVWDKYELIGRITDCSSLRIRMNPVIIKPLNIKN
jgi:hypothetical protein